MANLKGCFSHQSDDWQTPPEIYYSFINNDFIDPCPYHADFDGLERKYIGKKLFVNPPYSNIEKWVDWLIDLYLNNNCQFALLVPSRTDTKWFHKLLDLSPFLHFYKGRLHFNNSKNAAPFPSVLITTITLSEIFPNYSYVR